MLDEADAGRQLGTWIRSLRDRLGMRTTDLAVEADVNKRTIERWEAGRNATQVLAFLRLLDALGVDLKDQPLVTRAPIVRQLEQQRVSIERSGAEIQALLRDSQEEARAELRLLRRSVSALVDAAKLDVARLLPEEDLQAPPSSDAALHGQQHPAHE